MNSYFLPNPDEEHLIQTIQSHCRNEFVLIRLTKTMLDKSIMDASEGLRNLLQSNSIIEFEKIEQEEKVMAKTILTVKDYISEIETSYYRPKTKSGDPRFWMYGIRKLLKEGTLIYFTYKGKQLVAIPLVEGEFERQLPFLFPKEHTGGLILELQGLISGIKQRGFVKSVSPFKSNPKDVGNTLELLLGLKLNSIAKADYKNEIEIKTKRKKSGTKDSLFSCVPNWNLSPIKSAAEMILTYGYPSKVHPGFHDLYVTVNNASNQQGLLFEPDNGTERLHQVYGKLGAKNLLACVWEYAALKKKLFDKHPKTVWVVAEEKIINGEIHFLYESIELTQDPIFAQFISLIELGTISFDWRGKVKPDRTGYRDHGHGFRISNKERSLLFGKTSVLKI